MPPAEKGAKVYFPGLNGLRFLAAFGVIIHHIEMHKFYMGYPNFWDVQFVLNLGHLGVSLFFVLSGFLITYLLLAEQNEFGSINVKQFYIRRIFRIWPLYYGLLIILAVVLPSLDLPLMGKVHGGFTPLTFALYFFMLPNVVYAFGWQVAGMYQGWSVGVEEQFYLVWPVLMKKFKDQILWIFLVIVLGKALFYIYGWHFDSKALSKFMAGFQIEKMMMGGLGAYLVFYKRERILNWLYRPYMQVLNWVGIGVIALFKFDHPLYNVAEGCLFAILILNIACNPHSLLKLENKVFDALGKISYGLYMFHPIVISLTGLYFVSSAPLYSVSILGTFALSWLSYRYFETPFLRLKNKHALIPSRA